jgi:hypothetical protein
VVTGTEELHHRKEHEHGERHADRDPQHVTGEQVDDAQR